MDEAPESEDEAALRRVRELLDAAADAELDFLVEDFVFSAFNEATELSRRALGSLREDEIPPALGPAAAAWRAIVASGLTDRLTPLMRQTMDDAGSRILLFAYGAWGQVVDLVVAHALDPEHTKAMITGLLGEHPSPELIDHVTSIAVGVRHAAVQLESADHADTAVELLEAVLAAADEPNRLKTADSLAGALITRHTISGDTADLRRARGLLEDAIADVPADDPVRTGPLANLASVLRLLYDAEQDPGLLDSAVDAAQEAVEVAHGHPQAMSIGYGLVRALLDRNEVTHDSADVARAIAEARAALAAAGGDDGVRATLDGLLENAAAQAYEQLELGIHTLLRYEEQGDPADLATARAALEFAVAAAPRESKELALAASGLGVVLLKRQLAEPDPAGLDRALERFEEGARVAGAHPELLPTVLQNLGEGLTHRYESRFDDADLDAAIETYRRALAAEDVDPVIAGGLRAGLGNALRLRSVREGDPGDLDAAIELFEQATEDLPLSDERARTRSRLGTALLRRYETTGRLADLHGAVDACRDALAATAEHAPGRSTRLTALATALVARAERLESRSDMDEAIALYEAAIAEEPTSANLANRLSSLGHALLMRHDLAPDPESITAAIGRHERAVELTAPGDPRLADRTSNLGNALMRRFQAQHDAADIARAVELQRDALALAADRPDRRTFELGLANCLSQLHEPEADAEADGAYRRACADVAGGPAHVILAAARNWGSFASEREAWPQAAEAYELAVTALQRLFRSQVGRPDKETWLKLAMLVPAQAGYALARAGRPEDAVVALENARALLLSDALERDRADLGSLRQHGAAELELAYREAAQRVRALEADALAVDERGPVTALEPLAAAQAELDRVVERIRAVPGHEDFLRAATFDDVRDASAETPIAYVLAAMAEGMVLTVAGRSVTIRRLPTFSQAALVERVVAYLEVYGQPAWRAVLDDTAKWLWPAVAEPLLDSLPGDRVVLVPVGLAALLPIHAAWHVSEDAPTGRRYALDEALISYAPAARPLLRAHERADGERGERLVAAADAVALPLAAREVRDAAARFGADPEIAGDDEAPDAFLAKLADGDVLHFACHARADLSAPLESRLALGAGRELTAAQLMAAGLPRVRLAVLSACETAVAGTTLPDEAIGLSAALLEAGAAGVIGSLWRVPDASTLALMSRFYELWRDERLPPAEALRGAQQWVRDAPNSERRDRFPDVAGLAGDDVPDWLRDDWSVARDLGPPYHWAAFEYVGA